jgi:hypothetical protein
MVGVGVVAFFVLSGVGVVDLLSVAAKLHQSFENKRATQFNSTRTATIELFLGLSIPLLSLCARLTLNRTAAGTNKDSLISLSPPARRERRLDEGTAPQKKQKRCCAAWRRPRASLLRISGQS